MWYSKTVNETRGPKEGVVRITVEYEGTTKEMAKTVQNGLAQMGLKLNEAVEGLKMNDAVDEKA